MMLVNLDINFCSGLRPKRQVDEQQQEIEKQKVMQMLEGKKGEKELETEG